jgi:hypothetical protein
MGIKAIIVRGEDLLVIEGDVAWFKGPDCAQCRRCDCIVLAEGQTTEADGPRLYQARGWIMRAPGVWICPACVAGMALAPQRASSTAN